jgi:hypothetical protein
MKMSMSTHVLKHVILDRKPIAEYSISMTKNTIMLPEEVIGSYRQSE